MSRRRFAITLATTAAGLALLGACGQTTQGQPAAVTPAADAGVAAAPGSAPKLTATTLPGLGQVLTDQDGFTLYRFDRDTKGDTKEPSKSNCDGECAAKWPPMLADGPVDLSGAGGATAGFVTRSDGTKQVTVGGWPVYRFAQDKAPGEIKGQGVGGVWFAVTPTGAKAGGTTGGQPGQGGATGLTARQIQGIGPALTDQDGRTLYMFTKDSKQPPKTTCFGECAQTWPPVLTTGDVQLTGVDRKLVGTVDRGDGTKQVTVGGWPVYRYAKDTAAGQATGHGVKGVWFVIEPAGCKSNAPVRTAPPAGSGY
ncbi:putative lipoprotein with Yx(FWY)xxD motif [Herbihabitans rhizosphaerae]|uniref:Putative lipoprotein with Yx(FWY)xxD motif n=1 Tax=Herbihabitans rhizosphaerae TaxID=1872711 RepID=A0A4Q7KQU0_9PSEU|nr:SCO0930 family lipoprotein [Herbihabitans rhizosphaerae]RZS39218.1 putative lipoprotein with Yx(FWY)xxD motif [Herbihabitans rhizosphaerae]